jgi:hypothetical protein
LGQGLGAGLGNEAEGWIRSKLGEGEYDPLMRGIGKEQKRFEERYPVTSGATEFFGASIPAVVAAALAPATGGATAPAAAATGARAVGALTRLARSPYVRSAATSGIQGGISGAGNMEDDRLAGAIGGTVLGTGIGAATPAAIRSGKSVLDWARERLIPTDKFVRDRALGKLLGATESDGIKPGDILTRVQEDQAMGVPGMIGTASPSLARLADVAANRAGRAAAGTRVAFDELKEGSRERVMDQVRKGISSKNYFREEADAVDALRRDANTLYDDAYAFGKVNDPRLQEILQDPKFAAAFQRAKEINATKARNARAKGEDDSPFKMEEIYKFNYDKDGNITGFQLVEIPDVRTLDNIKRGVDSIIETGFRGEGMSSAQASAIKDLKKTYVKIIDEATTDPLTNRSSYAEARKKFAGDMEVIDAMRVGKADFDKLSHEEIGMLMNQMSDAEKDAFRTGVVSNVYKMIMTPTNDINAGKRLIGSPEMRAKFEQLFDGSQAKLDLFMAAVQREREMFQYAQRVLGGSQTAERLAARESFEEGSNLGEMIGQAINSGGLKAALVSVAARAISKTKMTDDVAEEVSRRLTSKDPMEVAAAVRELEEYAAGRVPKEKRLTQVESGLAGGTTVTMPSSPIYEGEETERDIQADIRNRNQDLPITRDIEADIAARKKR